MPEKKENWKYNIDKNWVFHMEIIKKVTKEPIWFTKNDKQKDDENKIKNKHSENKSKCIGECKNSLNDLKFQITNNWKNNLKEISNKTQEKNNKAELKELIEEKVDSKNKNFDKFLVNNLIELAKALEVQEKWLIQLIDRESWFNHSRKSETWAKWIMQLTSAPISDLQDKINWSKNYLDLIKKIPKNSINAIKNKWLKIAFERIQNWDENDYNRNIKEITSRAKEDPYCNIIVWCLHLAKLKENVNPNDEKTKEKIINKLNNIKNGSLDKVNELLTSKDKEPINQKDIDDIIKKLHSNEEYYKTFVSYINYNWDNKWDHKYLFAVAVTKSVDKKTNEKIS